MASEQWTTADVPQQHGKLVVITGGNSGIGYEAALVLAERGARVILAVRSAERGQAAVAAIRSAYPAAEVEAMELDLSDLASVRRFADAFGQRFTALPLLINNAGVMAVPRRSTADGFELQFGTNHLGHFALTGLLLPAILAAPGARVVTVSSNAHLGGTIDFDNLQDERRYRRWTAYSQSKLANLLFAYELERRFRAAGFDAISVACHPGYAATNLQAVGPRMSGSRIGELMMGALNRVVAQSAAEGALPTLYAATAPDVHGGEYYGPQGLMGWRGAPGKTSSNDRSRDQAVAARLWQVSRKLTGVGYEQLDAAGRRPESKVA